jgi:hypothetical protein
LLSEEHANDVDELYPVSLTGQHEDKFFWITLGTVYEKSISKKVHTLVVVLCQFVFLSFVAFTVDYLTNLFPSTWCYCLFPNRHHVTFPNMYSLQWPHPTFIVLLNGPRQHLLMTQHWFQPTVVIDSILCAPASNAPLVSVWLHICLNSS